MKQFIITDDFWSLFPDACFGIVLAHDVQNKDLTPEAMTAISKFLDESHHEGSKVSYRRCFKSKCCSFCMA
ncbi:hypothetical protein MX850_04045 [Erysipelothrix sp. Poltava]|nr:hypothetical protein MX850_04045 [Erysipelothrix sp. Poltava]